MTEMKISDLIVSNKMHVMCPLCKNTGKVMLTTEDDKNQWKHPRPCPICKGVGQMHKDRIPGEEEIAHAMMNYSFKK
jgi:DnaJ-class molecular chaperone